MEQQPNQYIYGLVTDCQRPAVEIAANQSGRLAMFRRFQQGYFASLAKFLLGLVLIGWLIYQAQRHQRFSELLHQPKHWGQLAAALACVVVAIWLSFLRWWVVVRGVELPFTLRDAVRLGSLGFALNFVAPGGVGGDLFKAVALAREQTKRRTAALGTVIADRLIGLTSLLLVAGMAMCLSGALWEAIFPWPMPMLAAASILCSVMLLGLGVLLTLAGRWSPTLARWIQRLPGVGQRTGRLLAACQAMGQHPGRFFSAMALGIATHLLLVLSFDLVARGLPIATPSLSCHCCIVPLAVTAGTLPITPGGLGTTEATLAYLYGTLGFLPEDGIIVALGQRVLMLIVGAIALMYYLTQRRSIELTLDQAPDTP